MNTNCKCTYPGCERHGNCRECVAYHRPAGELPACYFTPAAEKSYDRSIEKYLEGQHASKNRL